MAPSPKRLNPREQNRQLLRLLGSLFSDIFEMSQHMINTCSAPFYQLYNIRRIGKYLSEEAAEELVHSSVTCKIDYCNNLLYGLPNYHLAKQHSERPKCGCQVSSRESNFCHITPLLIKLHWIPISLRIRFKIAQS